MRYLFQRVVHNEHGWTSPSPGRLQFTGDGGYLEQNGFGHEDWLFSKDVARDGYSYGYTYYRPKDKTGEFNILFATYEKGEGWAICGFYKNATFQENGAKFARPILLRRAQELRRLAGARSLGGNYRRKSEEQITAMLKEESKDWRWKVRPEDIHPLSHSVLLPKALTKGFGAYFTRPTELDRAKWNELAKYVDRFADEAPQDDYIDGGDVEFPEGREYEARHKARERNAKLVKKVKQDFLKKHGRLYCEACGFDFQRRYGMAGEGFIEAHHTIPVSELLSNATTDPSTLALVCSNCHRILHRRRPWLSIKALRQLLKEAKSVT